MRVFWVDANVYMQAANGYYSFDLAPPFWKFVSEQLEKQTIRSPKMVFVELTDGNDELAHWARQRGKMGLGVNADKAVSEWYTQIAIHVFAENPFEQAKEFCRGGDGWVIAHAKAMGNEGIVVTHEDQKKRGKVKVPTVCNTFGVKWINLQTMLREIGFRFK